MFVVIQVEFAYLIDCQDAHNPDPVQSNLNVDGVRQDLGFSPPFGTGG